MLFFFASILFYALLLGNVITIPPRSEYHKVKESIERKLQPYSKDADKVDVLLGHLIHLRLSNPGIQNVVQPVVNSFVKILEHKEKKLSDTKLANDKSKTVFRACVTRQALINLKHDAFLSVLYNNRNLTCITKWMLALAIYRTPILNEIRAGLDQEGITHRDFAVAVHCLETSISGQLAHLSLEKYRLPSSTADIKNFCSFVNELKMDTMLSEDQLLGENSSTFNEAAKFACLSAFAYSKMLADPEQEKELMEGPGDRFSAVIIIQNINTDDQTLAESFLKTILSGDGYKDNVEQKQQVKLIPLKRQNSKDPNAEKVPQEYDLVMHFLCKRIPSPTPDALGKKDDFGTKIRERLLNYFSEINNKKTVLLLLSLSAYVLDDTKT